MSNNNLLYEPFVHLRVHSSYSLLEGAIQVKNLVGLVKGNDMPACALTDTNNLFGSMEFSEECFAAGIQPIMGVQQGVEYPLELPHGVPTKRPLGDGCSQLVFLAKNQVGWQNLMCLNSSAFLDATNMQRTPYITKSVMTEYREGLICLTGGVNGGVGRFLLEGQKDAAVAELKFLLEVFGDSLYIELQRHNLPQEKVIEAALLDFAYDFKIPIVATNDVFFATVDMHLPQDILMCIADGTYVGEEKRRRLTVEHRFKSASEMKALFCDLPEAIENTLVVAQRCSVRSPYRKPILPCAFEGNSSEADVLREMAIAGLETRLKQDAAQTDLSAEEYQTKRDQYFERLMFELEVISSMGFAGYFMIVADFIQWSKNNDIPVGPGRGSGAGSLVSWALLITDLDPIRWGLLFERFLNPERVSMPDFDIDFCQEKREQTIRYVQDKYGKDRVAQIITFGQLKSKAALRDVGRVLQMSFGHVDSICKLVPVNGAIPVSIAEARKMEDRLNQAAKEDEVVEQLLTIAESLEGMYRHASTHAAGLVISDRPLNELVPLYRDPKSEMPVAQYSMKYVEKAGLVKFDFLGLKTLTVLDQAIGFIKQRHGIYVNLEALKLDDQKTYELLGRGDTAAVFQLESSGMRDVLRKMNPDSFEDIIAIISLYRPGPMDNIPVYIARKKGKEKPNYLHPLVEDILKETYGIMIYQEQVLQIAQVMAGYSLGEADLLRRAMGKKIIEEMNQQRMRFVQGALQKGVGEQKAGDIFDLMAKFASYGFNKSHAAVYALIAYRTAYLKAHYPLEFMAASMNLDISNVDKLNFFKQDLEKSNFKILLPDINKSFATFEVDEAMTNDGVVTGVRYALGAIKGIGLEVMKEIVKERGANGAFLSIEDFASRINPSWVNRRQVENLAKAGVFDTLESNRQKVFQGAEKILSWAQAVFEQRESNQIQLFNSEDMIQSQKAYFFLSDVQDQSSLEKLKDEYDVVGFFLSAHPFEMYKASLKRLNIVPFVKLMSGARKQGGTKFSVAGTVISRGFRRTKDGRPFGIIGLSDPTGNLEVTFFSEEVENVREVAALGEHVFININVKTSQKSEDLLFIGESCVLLESVLSTVDVCLDITLSGSGSLNQLQQTIGNMKPGRGIIHLVVMPDDADFVARIGLTGKYTISSEFTDKINGLTDVVKVDIF